MKYLLIILSVFGASQVKAQDYKFVYYLNKDLVSTEKSKAVIIARGYYDQDKFVVDYFDRYLKVKLITSQFTDKTLSKMEGKYTSYYEFMNGKIEEEGVYVNGKEQGLWTKLDTTGRLTDSSYYETGKLVKSTKFFYDVNKKLYHKEFADSLNKLFTYTTFDENNNVSMIENFVGDKGELTSFNKDGITKRPIVFGDKKEATYVGLNGQNFSMYLRRNMNAGVASDNKAPSGEYTTVIKFVIDTTGDIIELKPETNIGYGIEKEAMRVIKESGKWQPAIFYGIKVKAFRRQPITFVVANE